MLKPPNTTILFCRNTELWKRESLAQKHDDGLRRCLGNYTDPVLSTPAMDISKGFVHPQAFLRSIWLSGSKRTEYLWSCMIEDLRGASRPTHLVLDCDKDVAQCLLFLSIRESITCHNNCYSSISTPRVSS